MKAPKKYVFLILMSAALAQFTFVACEKDDAKRSRESIFRDKGSNSTYDLNDQLQLNRLATIFAREKSEIKIVEDAAVVDLTDSKGNFKAISFRYQVGKLFTRMIVPIHEELDPAGNGSKAMGPTSYVRDTEACEMKCTTSEYCTACTQEIIERCKSQTCSCTAGNGGCTGSVVFPAE